MNCESGVGGVGVFSRMTKGYLIFNGLLYIIFGIWCTILPKTTANFLGLSWLNNSGRSEYITVYGGMEFGIGLFLLLSAFRANMQSAGLLFMLCFYAGLIVWRMGTFATMSGIGKATYGFAASELILGIIAAVLWFRKG